MKAKSPFSGPDEQTFFVSIFTIFTAFHKKKIDCKINEIKIKLENKQIPVDL